MGVWGTGVFEDDSASDIRENYRDYLGEGLSGPQATARVLEDFRSLLADPEQGGVVWLALAAAQSRLGRLEPDTLAEALRVIDTGSDLQRWEIDSKDFLKRKVVLEKLRAEITSPQPKEKKVSRRVRCACSWKVGDLVAYRLKSGKRIVFRVLGHHTDKGGTYPECELLDWLGEEIPSREVLESARVKPNKPRFGHTISHLMVVGINKKWSARFEELNLESVPSPKRRGATVAHAKQLDQFLEEWFDLV